MLGTIVNVLAIVVAGLFGIILKRGIREEYTNTITDGLGLAVVLIGISSGLKTENILLVIVSLVIGSIIGEFLGIEKALDKLAYNMEMKFSKGNDNNFSKGFITSSLVFTVGAMSVVGALEAGLMSEYKTLYAKSILDGTFAFIFASTFGVGVIFSALPVLVYQGGITLLAGLLKDILVMEAINEMSAVGGILIMAIGINLLNIKKINIANMLPAMFLPVVYYMLHNFI